MGKNELITKVAQRSAVAKDVCESVIDAFAEEIKQALVDGEKIMLKKFMSFEVCERSERDARNPKTGELAHYPAVKVIKCKASQEFKDAVNARQV